MEFDLFKEQFIDQLVDVKADSISGSTIIRQISSWDSMTAMAVQAMVEDNYKVIMTDNDWKNLVTVEDLFELVKSKV